MRNIQRLAILLLIAALASATSTSAQERIAVEAFVGRPFGVGRVTFEPTPEMLPEPLGIEGIGLSEKHGRVLYPAIDNPAFGKLMKEVLESNTPLTTGGPVRQQVGGILRGILDRPPRVTIYFLFRGDGPLDLTLETRSPIPLPVIPRHQPALHRRLLQEWWRQYAKPAGLLTPKPDFPPVLENYLTATLARRLNLRLPEDKQTASPDATLRKEIGLNLGTEPLRLAMQQDRILGLNNWNEPADQPLPPALSPPALQVPDAPDVKVEEMAMRVPAECFYVRFGNFGNFLWIQDTLAKWGGDCQNLIALRGLDRGMSNRIERQLVLKQTVLSRMLGGTVIADVALIGTDMFFREGASYGLLFHASNNFALSTSLNQQRQERIAAGAKEESVTIDGHTVSYLSTPDGVVRSYYVVDGDFHFVTTSKWLVFRFLATASSKDQPGKDSLGASAEFRHARSLMPLSRDDTVWVYISDAFFRNITSSKYRVEMTRRLQTVADIELVQMAKLDAAAEDRPGGTIEQLMAERFLPPEFAPLPDGSRVVLGGGEVYDSVRGRRGAFVPITDMPVDLVTRAEATQYAKFAEYYRAEWGRMDPIIAAIKRTALKGNRERVVVDVLMSPFAPEHFAILRKRLGPADDMQLARVPGDMAALELAMTDQRIFAGLRDMGPPNNGGALALFPLGKIRDFLVGYIGTTGDDLGMLRVFNLGIPPQSDAEGYAMSPFNGWRRQFGDFTVFSFQRDVLETVAPQLRFEQAKRPAQVRLRVDDVSNARITPALNDLYFARTRETSLGNLRFLNALDQQLHVPPAACREAAEFLLDGKMICPLGGKYVLHEAAGEPSRWTSTALENTPPGGLLRVHAPQGFQAPPLRWFRGLDLEATMLEKTVSAHADIIMQMPK